MFKLIRLAFRIRNTFRFLALWLWVAVLQLYLRRPSFSKKGFLGILLITLAAGVLVGQILAVQMFDRYAKRMAADNATLVEKNREKREIIARLETRVGLLQGKGKKVGWR